MYSVDLLVPRYFSTELSSHVFDRIGLDCDFVDWPGLRMQQPSLHEQLQYEHSRGGDDSLCIGKWDWIVLFPSEVLALVFETLVGFFAEPKILVGAARNFSCDEQATVFTTSYRPPGWTRRIPPIVLLRRRGRRRASTPVVCLFNLQSSISTIQANISIRSESEGIRVCKSWEACKAGEEKS